MVTTFCGRTSFRDRIAIERPLGELLNQIDFDAIADHWLARCSGFRPAAMAIG